MIQQFIFNQYQVNTYLCWDTATKEAIAVDPACETEHEKVLFDQFVEEQKLHLTAVVNTHCHIDHILGVNYVVNKYNTRYFYHADDHYLIKNAEYQAQILGFTYHAVPDFEPLPERLKVGELSVEVFHIPGHSCGGVAFYIPQDQAVITGDSLFARNIGRVDLPGGDYKTLVNAIKKHLLILPQDTVVLPGHGESSTIADEKQYNPYLQ